MSMSMPCEKCGCMESEVKDSRQIKDGIRRRRVCIKCGERYTTYERTSDEVSPLTVKELRSELWRKVRVELSEFLHEREEEEEKELNEENEERAATQRLLKNKKHPRRVHAKSFKDVRN